MGLVTFVDETTTGERRGAMGVLVDEERLALRELIRLRVSEEAPAEGADAAYERAIEAFGRNGFLVLVGDRQIVELDEPIEIAEAPEVIFLKLVPLVGG
ncbi:hypothetical protein [Streptomyces albipurpureus]|uniref:Uncharacterized protein n=1 Tax=Streptomyces albipurpureus TaxID=2897419 RepID=A0ABT0UM49_9ACTN|nr:hypothetical protein [Streptomyces sp. CWNU-1]MCM2389342.1 hypothetical protein [Streptomyces sp. CWNU-1]